MDALGRIEWDDYFMSLCLMISLRSLDEHTKLGCVVVDSEKAILTTGYNSPARGCLDHVIPTTRPEKYDYFEHAESNAIINAARKGISLVNSTFYISGEPCHLCFSKIKGVGAKEIVYGPIKAKCTDENSKNAIDLIKLGREIILRPYEKDASEFLTLAYKNHKERLGEQND